MFFFFRNLNGRYKRSFIIELSRHQKFNFTFLSHAKKRTDSISIRLDDFKLAICVWCRDVWIYFHFTKYPISRNFHFFNLFLFSFFDGDNVFLISTSTYHTAPCHPILSKLCDWQVVCVNEAKLKSLKMFGIHSVMFWCLSIYSDNVCVRNPTEFIRQEYIEWTKQMFFTYLFKN